MVKGENKLGYGAQLSGKEYDRKVADLFRNAAQETSTAKEKEIERRLEADEFNLLLDYKLGLDFPEYKRQALFAAKMRANGKRLKLVAEFLKQSLVKRQFADGMQIMLDQICAEFSTILSPEEMDALLDLKDGQRLILPLDPEKL